MFLLILFISVVLCVTPEEGVALCAIMDAVSDPSSFSFLGWDCDNWSNACDGTWFLVTCDNDAIIDINFSSGMIQLNYIPTEIGELAQLKSFHIEQDSSVAGTIPTEIGNLKQLTSLRLFSLPQLSGTIPTEIGELSPLQRLVINNVPLDGTIPSEIGSFSELTYLILQQIEFLSGTLPSEIFDLTQLEHLQINLIPFLSGSVDATITNLPQLEFLALAALGLSGTIPPEVGNMNQLTHLEISSILLLSGTIPTEIGKLSSLERLLILYEPLLSGTIPTDVGKLSSLLVCSLGFMPNIQGTIPTEIVNLQSLQSLHLEDMHLTGTIPSGIGTISSIGAIYLTNMLLSGTIPATFSGPDIIAELILASNHLSGNVPAIGSTINPPSIIDLSNNWFDGDTVFDDAYKDGVSYQYTVLDIIKNRLPISVLIELDCFGVLNWYPQDHDDCSMGYYICPDNQYCSDGWNPSMSYTCSCNNGYYLSGENCIDIDECGNGEWLTKDSSNGSPCESKSQCINTEGSFECCEQSYISDGSECIDVDECSIGSSCSSRSLCINTVGSFTCCMEGYISNGVECIDVNECHSIDSHNCQSIDKCINTMGSHECCAGNMISYDDTCISCYTAYEYQINQDMGSKFEALVPYDTIFKHNKCFGHCDAGIKLKTRQSLSTSCQDTVVLQESCSYPCTDLTEIVSPSDIIETLRRELTKDGFLADVIYKLHGVSARIEPFEGYEDRMIILLSPCADAYDEVPPLIIDLMTEIIPNAHWYSNSDDCSSLIIQAGYATATVSYALGCALIAVVMWIL